ncbi:MAG: type II toxin-antitoxin system VapC family toxin [Betaproteobacteria bacterium]|nr:type II toxin-antitoxin system VapC family toxin [Betaproteobacteria bacterium]
MNLVDSSGWLEYLADGPNAEFFAPPIEDTRSLIVPTISVLEVFKRVLQQRTENEALRAVALMRQGRVVDLDADLALSAAKLGREHGLPLADSVILATARKFDATIWTQDSDFESLKGVRYIAKT